MNTSEFQYPFAAPVVPIADPMDGLLQTVDLDRPVPVNIVVWDAVRAGYYMQLKLNDRLVGTVHTFTDADQPGDVVTLKLSEQLLANDGSYDLAFQATNPISLVSNSSPSAWINVDRFPPGAALLGSILFPTDISGSFLECKVPSYAGMQKGDYIQTVCNGIKGPVHTVTEEELVHKPVSIIFERTFLQSLGSNSVLIEYFVTDRAGNVSIMSLPVSLTLQVQPSFEQ
jgi:hypothetical protein